MKSAGRETRWRITASYISKRPTPVVTRKVSLGDDELTVVFGQVQVPVRGFGPHIGHNHTRLNLHEANAGFFRCYRLEGARLRKFADAVTAELRRRGQANYAAANVEKHRVGGWGSVPVPEESTSHDEGTENVDREAGPPV